VTDDGAAISKKYADVCGAVVGRVREEERAKYKKESERAKAVKTKLHSIYGAFVREGANKKTDALLSGVGSPEELRLASEKILRLHASTAERADIYHEFYEFIYGYIDGGTILDLGCGYNPFSLPFMPKRPSKYYAIDVDLAAARSINRYFCLSELPPLCACADLIIETPPHRADAAFMFKLMPVLESQRPGRGFALMEEINAARVVVTYPLKSLGGREKGMGAHYPEVFERAAGKKFDIVNKKIFNNELVYVTKKR